MSSLQLMARAAWSLAARASSSASVPLVDTLLTTSAARSATTLRAAAALPNLAAFQQLRAATSLLPLSRAFHRGAPSPQDAPAVNPLQQVPAPPSARVPTSGDGDPGAVAARPTARAILRNVAISPRKLNDFVRILRGLHVEDALIQCQMHPKKAAKIAEKVLRSAAANATNNHGLTAGALKVEEAWVGKGQHLRRVMMHGRGRAGVKHRYRSHLTVVLTEDAAVGRRTKVLPMMAERQKMWGMREGGAPPDNRWWRWWGKRSGGPPRGEEAQAEGEAA